jgi:L-threonylcarbamoyladenylate synthase
VNTVKTEWLNASDPGNLERAARLLRAGELVAVPTETVYGLAADATNPEAVARIFEAKQRPRNHPLIVHLAGADQLPLWAAQVPDWVHAVAERFWPGPLTLLLEKHPRVSPVITGGLPTIGLRVPNHPVLLQLLQRFDLAVAAPSANPYQKLSPTTAEQVLSGLGGRIAAVLDGGPCVEGTESTILRVEGEAAEILRSGPITAADLQPFLPFPVRTPKRHAHVVSGNLRVHYRPDASLAIKPAEELLAILRDPPPDTGFLVHSPALRGLRAAHLYVMPKDHRGYRRALYATLHELDRQVNRIIVEEPPDGPEWLDIWDRLSRAAAG